MFKMKSAHQGFFFAFDEDTHFVFRTILPRVGDFAVKRKAAARRAAIGSKRNHLCEISQACRNIAYKYGLTQSDKML